MSDAGELGQDLVTIPEDSVYAVFVEKKNIEPYLQKVKAIITEFRGDVSTAKGRDSIRSMAHKITKIKTYIEGLGKDLAAEQKEIPKKIDATRKYARETLEAWADEVRKPLTDWETAENERVKRHADTLTLLDTFARGEYPQDIQTIKSNIATVSAIAIGPSCEEFEADYVTAKGKAEKSLADALAKAEQAEADRIELERLRAEAAKRAAADRDAELQRQAAERAKREAEEAAQAEIDRVAKQAKEAEEAAARREQQLQAAKLKAEQDARDTEARLKREAEARAAQEKRDRLAREADTKHRTAINRAALAAFVEGGIDEDTAKKVIALIAKKMIPSIQINY